MSTTAIDLLAPVHRITIEQYDQMVDAGVFVEWPRVELIDGLLVEMSPMGEPHSLAIVWLTRSIIRQLDEFQMLGPQIPVRMAEFRSAPEPDIFVTTPDDFRSGRPKPLLTIEVSDASLGYDRITKARLYARRELPDYWIVNLRERVVEIHRAPVDGAYTEHTVHTAGATLRPLLLPDVTLELDDLLAFVDG
ncbi:MAG: Uma2 family endonuclease [Solirubrobacterales bacterium]|nr:Uma2 family endonuclease [Solirubrobacterales bacterium]